MLARQQRRVVSGSLQVRAHVFVADKYCGVGKNIAAARVIVVAMAIDYVLHRQAESFVELFFEPGGEFREGGIDDDDAVRRYQEHADVPGLPEAVQIASDVSDLAFGFACTHAHAHALGHTLGKA